MTRLISEETIKGARVLDIGCGSGIHALAFTRLGASSVTAIDIDPASVATTRATLERFAPDADYRCEVANVLQPESMPEGDFDIVYSWGVLHHTGAMWDAVDAAWQLTQPGGLLAIALYVYTPFCGAWRVEKKIYTSLPAWLRAPVTWLYAAICWLRILVGGKNPSRVIRE